MKSKQKNKKKQKKSVEKGESTLTTEQSESQLSMSSLTLSSHQSNTTENTSSQNLGLQINQLINYNDTFKDLNKNMAYILTKKYNPFKLRTSLLDDYSEDSLLNKSQFKGFYNLISVFSFVTIMTYPIIRYQAKGYFLNDNLIQNFKKDFLLCLISWPLFYLWSYTVFFIQKAIVLNKITLKTAKYLQILAISFLFTYCTYQVFNNIWCTSHAGYISMLACTHFMKMHSYYIINLEYRKDTEQSLKEDESPISPYPKNINIRNFTLYMWMPVLVYEYEYPRTPKIRFKYLIWKAVQTFNGIIFAYMLIADFVIPYVEMGEKISALELLIRLILPVCIFTLVIFFIIWEAILNMFAEVTRFGDRHFYDAWWNSTTYEEYNRKWNKSVYNFLFRHIYLECLHRYKMSKSRAQLLTFLISALLHEWILVLVFKIARPIMTVFMLQQIPLFYLTKHMQNTRRGNLLIWWGLILGIPLIGVSYIRCDPYVTQQYYQQREWH